MSSLSTDEPTKGLSEFFNYIWGNAEGFVYLPILDRKTEAWRKIFFKWPLNEKEIIQHVIGSSAKGLDVYFAPALFKGDGPNNPGRPIKSNVLGSNVLWAEFDGDAPSNWEVPEGDPAQNGSEAAHGPAGPVPAPTLRVQSSLDGHEHVYWRLDEFCRETKWFEDRNRSITYSLRSDPSGWDAVQILRPPYTTNYKRERPVSVIYSTEERYSSGVFQNLTPPPVLVNESIVIENLPGVEEVVAKYPWDPEHFKMFMDPQIEEGSRSSALMRLGYFCVEVGMSDTEAYAVLFNADERWGKYKGRQDQKKRLVDIIDRARQKHPNPTGDLTFAGLLAESDVETGTGLIFGLQDFLDTEVKVEWVVEGLIEKQGFGMVAAMPAVGKTQLSIQLGMCCALAEKFLIWEIPKPQKIVLLSLEMAHVGLKIFLETITRGYSPEQIVKMQENFIVVPIGQSVGLDTKEGFAFIETILNEVRPDGIIIDSVGKLSLEDLSEKTAKKLNDRYATLRQRYGTWIWLIHHNRKASDNNKKPTDLSDVYGNVYVTAEMSSVLILWDAKPGVEVIPVKTRFSAVPHPFAIDRDENLHFTVRSSDPVGAGILAEMEEKNEQPDGFFEL